MIANRPVPLWVETGERPRSVAKLPAWAPWIVLALLTLTFGAVYGWLSVERHLAFQSHAFDLGNMDQAVWNTLHGHPLRFTDMGAGHAVLTTRLAIHVEPILFALAPLYLIHSGPETLLVLQALVVGLGTIPAYLLARDALGRPWLALAFPLAYLAHPSLQNAVLDDFHAVALSACFLMWLLYCAYRGSTLGFWVFAVLAMSTKEEIGLLVATLGLAILLLRRHWRLGLPAVLVGFGWFVLSVAFVIPHFNPAGASPYTARYTYLGHGLVGIVGGMARHPEVVMQTLTSKARLAYLYALAAPFGFVSILGAPVLLLALPSFFINMLSSDSRMYSGQYQYSMEIVPYLVASAIFGLAAAQRLFRSRSTTLRRLPVTILAVILVLVSLIAARIYGFSPVAQGYILPLPGKHQRLEDRLLAAIPSSASIAAADEIEPHLTDRLWIYKLPRAHASNGPRAEYIILDASVASLPVTPRELYGDARWALLNGYGVVRAQDGILILKYGTKSKSIPTSFYDFLFVGRPAQARTARWGALHLRGVTVHPTSGYVTASRPDVAVEMYWQTLRPVGTKTKITVYVSPAYRGQHPTFSALWTHQTDSAAWDWLPLSRWPVGKTLRADSVPVDADTSVIGQVDVAIGVSGAGDLAGAGAGTRVSGVSGLIRVATLTTGY